MRSLRFSIAGLMGVVLLAALGSAALRNHSATCSGLVSLLTHGVLCLAFVGAVCRSGAQRAWWLGFALFGWIYLGLPFGLSSHVSQGLPTHALLAMLAPLMGVPIRQSAVYPVGEAERSFFVIGNYLWALLAAVLGGLLARALFGTAAAMPEETPAGAAAGRPGPAKMVGRAVGHPAVGPGADHVARPRLRAAGSRDSGPARPTCSPGGCLAWQPSAPCSGVGGAARSGWALPSSAPAS